MTQQSLNLDDRRQSESDFEEGRHLKVAVSSKGVCVSQLWESRKKKERFEKALNKVINGRLMPVMSKHALLRHQEKLRSYRQLITPFTEFNLPFEEDNRQKTLRDTEQIFRTSRKSRLSMKPVRIIQPQVDIRQDTPVSDTKRVSQVVDPHHAAETRKASLSVDATPASQHARKLSVPADEEVLSDRHGGGSVCARKARGPDSSGQPIALTRGRFDPYKHSPWSYHERRCFFTSNFVPPHIRNELPLLLERPAERDTPTAKKTSVDTDSVLGDK